MPVVTFGHGCGDLAQGIPCGRSRVACKGNLWLRKQIRRAEERAALSAPPSLIVTCRSARSACRPEGQLIRRSRPARALHRVSNHCVHGIGDAGVGAHDRRRNVFSSNKRLTTCCRAFWNSRTVQLRADGSHMQQMDMELKRLAKHVERAASER